MPRSNEGDSEIGIECKKYRCILSHPHRACRNNSARKRQNNRTQLRRSTGTTSVGECGKDAVFSQTKSDPKIYGPGSGYRGVWEPVISYTASAQITPTLISWVIYKGTLPVYHDLDRTTGTLTKRSPAGPYWNSTIIRCTPGAMSLPATKF